MKRLRFLLLIPALLLVLAPASGCGGDDPDPAAVLDRALTRERLSRFANGPDGPAGGVVAVQALGYEDQVLDERLLNAPPDVVSEIREALGADTGLRGLVEDLGHEGEATVDGTATEHVSGELDIRGLASALERAGGEGLGSLAGVGDAADLRESLAAAEFDLFAGEDDGVLRRLDLTLAFDDPGTALPPTRIRFSLSARPAP